MTPEDHARAAVDLLAAEVSRKQIGLLTKRFPEMDMDDAYACLLYTSPSPRD